MLINLWGSDCFQQFHPIYCTRIGLLICPLSVYGGILWWFTGCYHVKCSYDSNGTYIRGFSFLCFSTEISTGVDLCFFIGFKNIKAISNRLWYFIKCDYSRGLFALFLYFFIILAFVRTTLSIMSCTSREKQHTLRSGSLPAPPPSPLTPFPLCFDGGTLVRWTAAATENTFIPSGSFLGRIYNTVRGAACENMAKRNRHRVSYMLWQGDVSSWG